MGQNPNKGYFPSEKTLNTESHPSSTFYSVSVYTSAKIYQPFEQLSALNATKKSLHLFNEHSKTKIPCFFNNGSH